MPGTRGARGVFWGGALALLALGVAPCGAEHVDAPADPPAPEAVCPAPHELAPTLFRKLDEDAFADLREVVEDVLSVCHDGTRVVSCADPRAEPPASGVLLGSFLAAVGDFAADPPEALAGARPGEAGYCAPPGEVPAAPNRLCALRRAVDRLVLERTPDGRIVLVEAFEALQPLLASVLRYVDGTLPGATGGGRWDLLPVTRTVVERCNDDPFLDLAQGLLRWLAPPRGKAAFEAFSRLLRNPDAKALLTSIDVKNDVGRGGFLALARTLRDALTSDGFDPAELQSTFEDLVYPFVRDHYPDHGLEADLRGAVDVLVDVLDPQRSPGVLRPLQEVVLCAEAADPDDALLGASYDLLFDAEVVGLDALMDTLSALTDADPDGTVLEAAGLLLRAFAEDRDARVAFSVVFGEVLTEENARKVLPVLVDLLESDVVSEIVVLGDVLLRGCGSPPP